MINTKQILLAHITVKITFDFVNILPSEIVQQ